MSTPDVTPAIRRGAERMAGTYLLPKPDDLELIHKTRVTLDSALDVEEMARVDAETTRCSWSIPQDGHPYNESCLYKRDRIDGQVSHGACWDASYARAAAYRAAILGGAA